MSPLLFAAALACKGPIEITDVSSEVSEVIPTVVTVRWTTDTPTTGFVRFGPELSLSTPVSTEPTEQHEVLLLGLGAETATDFEIEVGEDEREISTASGSATTGALPNTVPSMETTGDNTAGGYMVVPVIGGTTGVTIISPEGEVVWFYEDTRGLDVYRARLSNDGQSVIYNAASISGEPEENSELVRVALDGSWEETTPVSLLAHDFVQMDDGTIGAIAVEYREHGGEELRGDRIVEITPDGTQTDVWSAWDCFDPDEHPGDATGWTFANALDYLPEHDAYMLGMRNQSTITWIDRASGACEWSLGGKRGTLSFTGDSQVFLHQHQFEMMGDDLLVFDNEGSGDNASRVTEYALDLGAGTATQTWTYTADPSIFTFVLGDVNRFDDGDTLVTWSVGGQIDQVSPDGTVSWQLNTELGYAFGFDTVVDSLYAGTP